jgi:hypothetical protein
MVTRFIDLSVMIGKTRTPAKKKEVEPVNLKAGVELKLQ